MMLIIKCPKLLHYLHNYDKLNHQISICWQFDSSVSSWEIGNEMEMKVVLLYLCCWRCSSFSTLCRPITGKKCKKAAPRKVHKAEREKLKRDHLNDLFIELGNMLGEHSYANILSFSCFRVHVCCLMFLNCTMLCCMRCHISYKMQSGPDAWVVTCQSYCCQNFVLVQQSINGSATCQNNQLAPLKFCLLD